MASLTMKSFIQPSELPSIKLSHHYDNRKILIIINFNEHQRNVAFTKRNTYLFPLTLDMCNYMYGVLIKKEGILLMQLKYLDLVII